MSTLGSGGDISLSTWEQQAEAVERKNDELNRDQWKLVRDHVHTNTREVATLKREIDALKGLFTKFQGDTKNVHHDMTNRLDKIIVDFKQDNEEEKNARTTKLTAVDRQLVELTDRLDARDAADETSRQKTDHSIASAKKDGKELVDAAVERIALLESAVSTQLPTAMNDLKIANQKLRESMIEQVNALKETQEIHKAAASDVVGLERKAREAALADLHTNINRRLQEEKASNENRRNLLQESFEAGIASEKDDRDACIKNVHDQLQIERSKRKEGDEALKDFIESTIADERGLRESAHADLHGLVSREKSARDAHQASMQALLNEERAARDAHMKDVHAMHNEAKDSHKDHLHQELSKERSLRDAALADMKELLSGHHDHFNNLVAKESASRGAHIHEKLNEEAQAREQMLQEMFEKCRAEGDAVLQGKIDAEVAMREAAVATLNEMIENETAAREEDVGELQDIIGAERKAREDHHIDFATRLKEHRDELDGHKDSLHAKLEKEREDRKAHHDSHHEHMKGLLTAEGDARGKHHDTLMSEIEDLKNQVSIEADARAATIAELRKSLSLLEDVIGDGNESEGSNAAKNSKVGMRRVASPPVDKREMVPLSRRFQLLEEKILTNVERESAAREAHGGEMRELIALESQKREEYHGTLTEQLDMLHGRHGDLQGLLEKERAERAAHLDAHGKERDELHSALQSKLHDLHGKHDDHRTVHMTFQETVNQMLADEVAKLEDLVATENKNIIEVANTVKEEIEAVKRDLSDGLAKEGALRDSNETSLREVLSRRMEYFEAVLDGGADDTMSNVGGLRSPGIPPSGGSVANAFTRRVVTLQQRLDGLENRLRGDLAKEANIRDAERSRLNDLLEEETKSRKDLDSSVKARFERERATIEARVRDDGDKVGREIESLRHTNSKMVSELDQRGKVLEATVERETSALKQVLEEEKGQRMTADKAIERTLVALTERFSAEEANSETHRQRFDLALAGQKKDTKEKHDLAIERIGSVENHVHEVLPAVVTELREADHKNHQSMKEQIDGVKALQESHRNAVHELVALEKAKREETINDLHSHMNTRFLEEKAHRDGREGVLHESVNARFKDEKEDRDAGHKALSQALAAERTKREAHFASVQEACDASVAGHRRDSDAKHSEMKSLIEREREAREAHRAMVQSQHDEAQKAKEAHAKEVNKNLDAHRQEHRAALDKETGSLRSSAKEQHDRLDELHKSLKRALDEEVKTRDEHIGGLNEMLEFERNSRETLINKHKSEYHGLLKEEVEAIRKEVTSAVNAAESKREGGHNTFKEMLSAAMKRLTTVEVCLSDKSTTNNLLTVSHELDEMEKKLRAEVVKEATQRESVDAALRVLIDEEVSVRKASDMEMKSSFQREASERDKAVKDSTARLKAAMVAKLHLI
jgi:hypothetical protein